MKANASSRFALRASACRSLAVAAALQAGFAAAPALALPTGGQVVVPGSATIGAPLNNALTVTNNPGAIIHWQSFSIAPNELVRFVQQSAASAVLNRVTGPQMSQILGRLQSNGQVFLINPNGIVVGPNAVIDTAAFVASTLRITDADFLAGRLRFQGDGGEGRIVNQGQVRAGHGGRVLLVAPRIENAGLIEAPGGSVVLAAGRSVTVSGLDPTSVSFEVQAPADAAVNLGQLSAPGGAVAVFAGTLRHSGEIRADALTRDAAGQIVLQSRADLTVAAGSRTTADGRIGGSIVLESLEGATRVEGQVSAAGRAGSGGSVQVLGDRVSLAGDARVDASGAAGGGTILVGGDWQGGNPSVRNAQRAFVGAGARLSADATDAGDGGKIVVWADGDTRFLGSLSARGGPNGGHGGVAEVSGRGDLLFIGGADLGAPRGTAGSLLLDPLDLFVDVAGGLNPFIIDEATDFPNNAVTVSPATLAAIVGDVMLYASRDLRFNSSVLLTGPGQALSAVAGRDLQVGAALATSNGAVSLTAGRAVTTFGAPSINAGTGAVSITSGTTASGGGGTLSFGTIAGAGSVVMNALDGSLNTGAITASGPVSLSSNQGVSASAITTTGQVTLSAGFSATAGNVTTGGGNVAATGTGNVLLGAMTTAGGSVALTAGATARITGGNLGAGNLALTGASAQVTGTVTLTGTATFTANAGSISGTVNDAASVVANATNPTGSVSVSLGSSSTTTPLNATLVTATTPFCFSSTSCSGATINLSGQRGVAVGTVTANAPATFRSDRTPEYQSRSRSVTVNGQDGPITALGAGSLITATDVTLRTNQGAGGGIGTASQPVRVSVERGFDFRPNGEFNVLLSDGPIQFSAEIGVAPTGQSYTGTLARAGEIALAVSATDSVVTAGSFSITGGFNRPVYGGTPSISLSVPNGGLVATSVAVPAGDQVGFALCPSGFGSCSTPSIVGLNASFSAGGAAGLQVASYARAPGAYARTTTFSASGGPLALGAIAADRDNVNASGRDSVTVTNLSTSGNVSVGASPLASSSGNVTVDRIAAGGSVTINGSGGTVGAANDGPALEVTAGGTVAITAASIGTGGYLRPLDVAAPAVSFTANGSAAGTGYIGSGPSPFEAVTAATPQLTVSATRQFHIDTGTVPLVNLTVAADPAGVGSGGFAGVRSDGLLYPFLSDGSGFTLGNLSTTTQFAGGTLSFTTTGGAIRFGNIDFSATGGNLFLRTNQNGTGDILRDPGPVDLGSGVLSVRADRNVTLGDLTVGGLSVASVNGSFPGPGACETIGSTFVCATNTVTAGNITDPTGSGSFSASTRRAIAFGNLDGIGSLNLNAASLGVTTGTIGSAAAPAASVTIVTESTLAGGDILTGAIEANALDLRSGSALSTGGAAINAGSAASGSLVRLWGQGAVSAGAINAGPSSPGLVDIRSDASIVTGTIEGGTVRLGGRGFFAAPAINVGAIGSIRPGQQIVVQGASVTVGALATDPAASGSIDLYSGGDLVLGGPIVAGNGSSVSISASNSGALQFSRIDAGDGGWVAIGNPNGIEQTLPAASGGGIRAALVDLSAGGVGSVIGGPGADNGELRLREVTDLRLVIGSASRIRLSGAAGTRELANLDITRNTAGAPFVLADLAPTQALTVNDTTSGTEIALDNSGGGAPISFRYVNNDGVRGDLAVVGGLVTRGGSVELQAPGHLALGRIDTVDPSVSGSGAAVTAGAGGTITVNDLVDAGSGFIQLSASTIAKQPSSPGHLVSTDRISLAASNGDIGSVATPVTATTPSATLSGRALHAALTGTTALGMTVVEDLAVTSSVALESVTLTIDVDGAFPTSLTGAGQSFGLARPGGVLEITTISSPAPLSFLSIGTVGGGLVVIGSGANAIAADTVSLSAAATLKLDGSATPVVLDNLQQGFFASAGNIEVDGRATIMASGSQEFRTFGPSGDILLAPAGGAIAVSGGSQSLTAGRDVKLLGGAGASETVTLTATGGSQIVSAGRSIVAAAGTGANASVAAHASGGAQIWRAAQDILLTGGGTAGGSEAAVVTITQSGPFEQRFEARGSIVLTGGLGADSSVALVQSGGGSQIVGDPFPCCSFYRTPNVRVLGGEGDRSFAEVVSNGQQSIQPYVLIEVRGGDGADAHARIASTSSSEQRIGAPTYFCCSWDPVDAITVAAGTGNGSFAEITAAGFQRVTAASGMTLAGSAADGSYALVRGVGQDVRTAATNLAAGAGSGADARIQSVGGGSQYLDPSALTLTGGGSAGATTAVAKIDSDGSQQIAFAGNTTLAGGVGPHSDASIVAAGSQSLSFGNTTLIGGSGVGSSAQIESTGGAQSIGFGSLTLSGGTVAASGVSVQAAAGQSISAGTVNLFGGTGAAGNDSGATIVNLAGSQTFSAGALAIRSGASFGRAGIVNFGANQQVSGTIAITTAAGPNVVDAPFAGTYHAGIVQAGGGSQTINGSVSVDNLHTAGDIGIVNRGSSQTLSLSGALSVRVSGGAGSASIETGSGTQAITAPGGVLVRASAGAGEARIVNTGGAQTIASSAGGVQVQAAGGSGNARIGATGSQSLAGVRFIEVTTASGATGNAELVSGGDQTLVTTNGFATGFSLKVTSLGTGTARVEATGNQRIEADYPSIMQQSVVGNRDGRIYIGDPAALGPSLVRGADQDIFARAILVRGGASAAATAKLDASGTQTISILTSSAIPAGITVAGGAGGSAQIDPVLQTILSNGPIQVLGGSGPDAFGLIQSFGPQTVLVTNAPILAESVFIQGGSGANAYAAIATVGPTMQLGTVGGIELVPGSGVNADAVFGAGLGNATAIACGTSFVCSFSNLTSNPFFNGATDVGVFSNPTVIPLSAIVAPLAGPSGGASIFDPATLLLTTLGDLDRALEGDEEEERTFALLGRRLLLCR